MRTPSQREVQVNLPDLDPTRDFVGSKIAVYEPIVVHAPDRRGRLRKKVRHVKVRSGWNPIEAIAWAQDREHVAAFQGVVALSRLCADPVARMAPEHSAYHGLIGLTECIGYTAVRATGVGLGFDDARMQKLIDRVDDEVNAVCGLGIDLGER